MTILILKRQFYAKCIYFVFIVIKYEQRKTMTTD